jgi:hypothetical protein
MLPLNTLSRVNRLTLLSLYFGEEKGIKTEVGEVHETLRKKETKGTERDRWESTLHLKQYITFVQSVLWTNPYSLPN